MKKVLATVLVAILAMFVAIPLTAITAVASEKPAVSEAEVDAIHAKLSAEYGIEIRKATPEELQAVGLTESEVRKNLATVSAEEFEKHLRATVEENQMISQEAREKARKAGISEDAYVPITQKVTDSIVPLAGRANYTKSISGGIAVLDAYLDDSYTYNRWGAFYSTWVLSGSLYSSPPFFVAQTYTYQYLDMAETIAVSYTGFLTNEYGDYLGNASRYVEFYASSYT